MRFSWRCGCRTISAQSSPKGRSTPLRGREQAREQEDQQQRQTKGREHGPARFLLTTNDGLVTVDTYRVAAVEQLRTYADIIDLPMEVVSTPKEMRAAVARLSQMDLILMDTAAEPLTIFPQALREQLAKDVRANGCASRVKAMREMPVAL